MKFILFQILKPSIKLHEEDVLSDFQIFASLMMISV